jgi:hypothetical protein
LLAPRWTRKGYKGRLKDAVLNLHSDNEYDADIGERNEEEEKNENGEKNEVLEEVVEETVLMTSNDQHIDENSDDEYLEMDDNFNDKS